ncbi:MAG: beta-ketoacyl synthase chain length factor [Gammaproteobacteria bacterium]
MDRMSILGFAAGSPDAELRERLPFPCGDIERNVIPAMLRRRSSQAIGLAFSVAYDVCNRAGRLPGELPVIFASVAGEIRTTDQICVELAKADGLISPSAFHNSVQNTAAGYWSIAHQCTQPASALAGGSDTVAMALLEAWCQLSCQGGELLLVCYDECWPAYLAPGCGRSAFAVAFILAAGSDLDNIGQLARPERQKIDFPAEWMAIAKSMPILSTIPLLVWLANKEGHRTLPISGSPDGWQIEVMPKIKFSAL